MKRKISAILAADVAGYSKLVAEDEEETLRRLGTYRAVFDDFVARYGGRVFNTAGDAVLAEFSSSVDAVRCALDVQESIRTRNLAYPASRQMAFRIGITLGDVVEREGDLLGDGVNIAARLEGIAVPGGICVSRTVHEQVTNKVSIKFEDIGLQQVKNIPDAIHVYSIAPHSGEHVDKGGHPQKDGARRRDVHWFAAAVIGVVLIAASVAVTVLLYKPAQTSTEARSVAAAEPASGAVAQRSGDRGPQVAARPFDEAKFRAYAAERGISLPPTVRVIKPGANVPAQMASYVGAWGGDDRWNRVGRLFIVVVESVDDSGAARGFYCFGPAVQNQPDQSPSRYAPFIGAITEAGLVFPGARPEIRFSFKVASDGFLWGTYEANIENARSSARITLERIS